MLGDAILNFIYADCHVFIALVSVVMLNIEKLDFIMLNIVMLNVIMLSTPVPYNHWRKVMDFIFGDFFIECLAESAATPSEFEGPKDL